MTGPAVLDEAAAVIAAELVHLVQRSRCETGHVALAEVPPYDVNDLLVPKLALDVLAVASTFLGFWMARGLGNGLRIEHGAPRLLVPKMIAVCGLSAAGMIVPKYCLTMSSCSRRAVSMSQKMMPRFSSSSWVLWYTTSDSY